MLCGAVILLLDDRDMFVGVSAPGGHCAVFCGKECGGCGSSDGLIDAAQNGLRTNGMQRSGAFYTERALPLTKRQGLHYVAKPTKTL